MVSGGGVKVLKVIEKRKRTRKAKVAMERALHPIDGVRGPRSGDV